MRREQPRPWPGSAGEREDLRALDCVCSRVRLDGRPQLDEVLEHLRRLLRADWGVSTLFARGDEGFFLDHFEARGVRPLESFARAVAAWVEGQPPGFVGYDPSRPAPEQRNRACIPRELLGPEGLAALPLRREVYAPHGLDHLDEVRVLVCDGPVLLGWMGGFREEPFGPAELRRLRAAVPILRRWLLGRARLDAQAVGAAALSAVLESIATAAFVLASTGRVVHANSAGQRLLDSRRRELLDELRACAATGRATPRFEVTPFAVSGAAPGVVVVERALPAGREPQLQRAVRAWGLTPRQTVVLGLLVEGRPNRSIALHLGCSEKTVEAHVSALLLKAGADSRASVVARFWGEL